MALITTKIELPNVIWHCSIIVIPLQQFRKFHNSFQRNKAPFNYYDAPIFQMRQFAVFPLIFRACYTDVLPGFHSRDGERLRFYNLRREYVE